MQMQSEVAPLSAAQNLYYATAYSLALEYVNRGFTRKEAARILLASAYGTESTLLVLDLMKAIIGDRITNIIRQTVR